MDNYISYSRRGNNEMGEKAWIILIGFSLIIVGVTLFILMFKNKRIHKSKERPKICIEEFIEIGGIKQYLYHRGTDVNNPVILYLHGGPGFSMIPLIHTFQGQWEKSFTVVHWDQRNTGRTYYHNAFKNISARNTMEQLIEDTHEICLYLKEKYHKDGVILIGHSFGSALGLLFARKYPEDVICYFGTGQMVGTIVNERTLYEKALAMAKTSENNRDIKRLQKMNSYPTSNYNNETMMNLFTLRGIAEKYNLFDSTSKIKKLIYQTDHHLSEYCTYLCADNMRLHKNLYRYMFEEFDLKKYDSCYKVPIFFILGSDDFETPYTLAEEYFATIEAPHKNITLISNAKHFPMIDSPEEFYNAMLRDVKSILI